MGIPSDCEQTDYLETTEFKMCILFDPVVYLKNFK